MAELYSGAYEFGEPEEAAPGPRQPHQPVDDGPVEPPACLEYEEDSPPVSPPPSPPPSPPLLYVRSERLQQLSRRLPVNADRPELVHGLVEAYGLLEGATVSDPQPASAHQLLEFHSRPYLQALAAYDKLSERQRGQYGLEDDCAPFPGLYEHAALTAGGSLAAADGLCSGQHRLAVHLDGGRHHAHKDKAAGFCYVNDVVLAILALLCRFRRVMYVDIDVHHGDAVEEAFHMTHRVLTVSMHKHAPGFFPGSGATGAGGAGSGRGFALNLSLADGLRDDLFLQAFAELAGGAAAAFRPDCVVLQCGVDGLAHDPIAQAWALTPAAYAGAAAQAASWGAPLLLLGGGGYSSPAAACTWAGALAALLGRQLPDDIPEHEQFERYGPAFTLSSVTRRLLPPDTNDRAAVLASCKQLVQELQAAVERTGSGGQAAAGGAAKRARQAAASLTRISMAREAEASSEAAAGPSLLHLPANCLERVAELVLFCDEDGATHLPQLPACTDSGAHFRLPLDATAGPLLACKALWRAAEAVLHHCLHVGVLYGGLFPPFEQQLQGTVQQLVLATLERWAAHARFDQQLEIAAARSPHLRHLSIHHGLTRAGQWPRVGPWPAQLLHFTALESLTFSPLEATVDGGSFNPDSWPALPGTLRRLTLCVGPVTDSLLDSLAALSRLSSLELYCRTFEADAGSMPLSRLPLCTLRIEVSSSAQPQHVLELPQLNVDLQELFVTGPSLQDFYEPSDFLLADSGAWLGMSRLRRLTLARFQLEAPPDRLQFPALESLHLAQCYSDWLERPVLSRLSRLTALVLQHCGFLFCDLSPVTPLRKLCVTAEGHILLPTGVPQLSHLTALDLSWNELESLPAGPYLSSLRHLNISYNKFSSLPPVLAAATALEVLDVTGCSELRAYNACVLARMPALVTVHLKQLEPYDEYEADEEQRLWQLSQLKYEIRLATELQADLRRRRASQPPLLDTTSRLVIASLLFPEGEIRIRREAGW